MVLEIVYGWFLKSFGYWGFTYHRLLENKKFLYTWMDGF